MNTTPKNINLLLERLKKSEIACFACQRIFEDDTENPITFSRVKHMVSLKLDTLNNREFEVLNELDRLWLPFGYETTFNEIIEASGYEEVSIGIKGEEYQRLRSEPARNLCELLFTLFIPQK